MMLKGLDTLKRLKHVLCLTNKGHGNEIGSLALHSDVLFSSTAS